MELRNTKFNGKIYGKAGAYTIYVNNQPVKVSDEDVLNYNNYTSALEKAKEAFPQVFKSIEVSGLANSLGLSKPMMELTLEQMIAYNETFLIEEREAIIDEVKCYLEIAKYEGQIIAMFAYAENGYSEYIDKTQFDSVSKQFINQ